MKRKFIKFNLITLVIFIFIFNFLQLSKGTTTDQSSPQTESTEKNNLQLLFQKGKKLYALNEFNEALGVFESILEQNPSYTLASIYKKKCEYYLAQSEDKSETSDASAVLHKKALREAKDYLKKEKEQQKSEMRELGKQASLFYKEGKKLFSKKKHEEAITQFNNVLKIEKDSRIKKRYSDYANRYIQMSLEAIKDRPEMVTLVKQYDKYEEQLEKEIVAVQVAPPKKEKVKISVKPVPIFEAPPIKKRLQSRVSLDFQDVSLKFLLDYLAESTGANLALSALASESDKKITVKLKEVTCEEALKYILKSAGLNYRLGEDVVWVASPEEMSLEQVETRIYKLKGGGDIYAEFSSLAEGKVGLSGGASIEKKVTLKDIIQEAVSWPQDASIVWDPRSSALIVSNIPRNLEIIEELLYELDIIPVQVLIEARFIEINITDLSELGIDWPLDSDATIDRHTPGNAVKYALDADTGIDFEDFTRQSEGFNFVLKGVLSDPQFKVVMHALQERQNAKTLSSPRIMTLNNQEAAMKVVDEWIYPTRYEFEIVQNDENGDGDFNDAGETQYKNVPKDFVKRDVGILLKVTPSVGDDLDTINLHLMPEVSEATADAFSYTGGVTLPKFSTRNLATSIVVNNGETVVLGGLIKESRSKTTTKVPLLADLPWIGKLFKKERDSIERKNLIIFITAKVIDPSGAETLISGR